MKNAPKKIRSDTAHRLSFKTIVVIAGLFLAVALGSSCTATYGDKFVADPQMTDQYHFKIYVAAIQLVSPEPAAEKRIKEFMAGTDYTKYEIVWRAHYEFPFNYIEYTVKFSK
jgi:hypothetical protein